MYHVRYGSEYIQDPSSETRRVITGQISEEVNEAPSFNFSIAPNHPALEKLKERDMDDFVTVTWEDDNGEKELFWGFIDEIDQSLNTEVKVYCKGNLALLQDMMLPAYSTAESETQQGWVYYTSGENSGKFKELTDGYDPNVVFFDCPTVQYLIEEYLHQATAFLRQTASDVADLGMTDFDFAYKSSWGTDLATECAKLEGRSTLYRSNTSVSNFWEEFQSKILEAFGCFVYLWHDNYDYSWSNTERVIHLAIFADVPDSFLNSQTVQFGKTITEYKSAQSTSEVYNAVYVQGDEVTDAQKSKWQDYWTGGEDAMDGLTLDLSWLYRFDHAFESGGTIKVSSSRDDLYLQTETGILYARDLVSEQGLKLLTDTGSDATTYSGLLSYATNLLLSSIDPTYSFEVNAVDCVFLGEGEHLSCNQKARVLSAPHDLDEILPVSKASIDITSPANTKYTFGDLPLSITKYYKQKQSASETKQQQAVKDAKEAAKAAEKKAQEAQDTADEAINSETSHDSSMVIRVRDRNAPVFFPDDIDDTENPSFFVRYTDDKVIRLTISLTVNKDIDVVSAEQYECAGPLRQNNAEQFGARMYYMNFVPPKGDYSATCKDEYDINGNVEWRNTEITARVKGTVTVDGEEMDCYIYRVEGEGKDTSLGSVLVWHSYHCAIMMLPAGYSFTIPKDSTMEADFRNFGYGEIIYDGSRLLNDGGPFIIDD